MVSHDREGASKPHGEGVRLEDRRKREREPGRSARPPPPPPQRARVLLRTAEIPRRVHMGVRQRGRPVPLNHGDPS